MFPELNLPQANLKLTKKEDKYLVWDMWRQRNLVITPEEWVRQHLLHYLVDHLAYPKGLIASEQGIQVNGLSRRCDAVVYGKDGSPLMIIECKAPEVQLSEETFYQIAQYNFKLRVNYMVLSNGLMHVIAKINPDSQTIDYLSGFPFYPEISK
jgi:predicted type IV restriction endonuclease